MSMTKSKPRLEILWGAFAFWLLLIFFLSSQDGPGTAKLSRWLADIVTRFLRLAPRYRWEVEALLRTAAHFGCFFGLGVLLYVAMRMTFQKTGNIHFWAAGSVSALGVLDEVKKAFISGRHLSWEEAGLNVIGAWCGIIIAMAAMELISAGPKAGAFGLGRLSSKTADKAPPPGSMTLKERKP